MEYKANLHFHAAEDPRDNTISYTAREGIDYAARSGFGVLALTFHETAAWTPELSAYARERGVLLLPGIEKNVGGGAYDFHTLILNCGREAEQVHTYADLRAYRRAKPDIFVIAAHPYYLPGIKSHGRRVEHYSDLFDAIEHSWFYTPFLDKNKPAEKTAQKLGKPFIATSDTHFFDFFNTDYALVNAAAQTPEQVFAALRGGAFRNVTRPKKLVREMVLPLARFEARSRFAKISSRFSPKS